MSENSLQHPTFSYSAWRHGGWYVHGVRYPSGAIGCVSRNYPDKKWRVVCQEHLGTFASRDGAALAEHLHTLTLLSEIA